LFVTADGTRQTRTVRIRRDMDTDLDETLAAEGRIAARSRERQRRAERRERRRRRLLWACAPFVLPSVGAAAALALLDREGGDLAGWSTRSTVLAAVLVFGVPAAITLWLARRRGPLEAVGWAAITLLAQVALVFWVGLVALELGPD
jgi:cation transport ATPase